MKKKIFIIIDILLILATLIPAGWYLWVCIDAAINGVIPWGGGYGVDYGEMIYGFPAFANTFCVMFAFLFVLVVLWGMLALGTIIFTVITVLICKKCKSDT